MFKPTLKRSKLTQLPKYSSSTGISSKGLTQKDKAYLTQKLQKPDLYIPSLFNKNAEKQLLNKSGKIISPLNNWNLQYPLQVKQKLNLPIDQVKSRLIGSKFGIYWLITQKQLYIWRYDSFQNPTKLTLHRKFQFQKNLRVLAIGFLSKQQCSLSNYDQNCAIIALGFQNLIDLYTINIYTLQLRPLDIRIKVQYKQIIQKMQITNNNELLYTGDQGYLTRVSFTALDRFGYNSILKSNAKPSLFAPSSFLPSLVQSKTRTKLFTEQIVPTQNKIYVLIRKQSESTYLYKLGSALFRFLSGKIRTREGFDQNSVYKQKQIHVYQVIDRKLGYIKFCGVIHNADIERKIKQSYAANQKLSQYVNGQASANEGQNKKSQQINNINNSSSIVNIYAIRKSKGNTLIAENNNDQLGIVTSFGLYLVMRQNVVQSGQNYYNIGFDQAPKMLPQQLFSYNLKSKAKCLFMRGTVQPSSSLRSTKVINRNVSTNIVGRQRQDNINQYTQQQYIQPLVSKNSFKIAYSFGYNSLNILDSNLCFCFDEEAVQICQFDKNFGHIIQSTMMVDYNQVDRIQNSQNRIWVMFSKDNIAIIRKSNYWEYILAFINSFVEQQKISKSNKQKYEQIQYYSHSALYQIGKIIGFNKVCEQLCRLILKINYKKTNSSYRIPVNNIPYSLSQKDPAQKRQQTFFLINSQFVQIAKQQHTQTIKIKSANALKYQLYSNFNPNSNSFQNSNIYFMRWLLLRKKNIKLQQLEISEEIQHIIWRYFVLYALDKTDERIRKAGIPGSDQEYMQNINFNINNNPVQQLSIFSKFIFNIFKQNYEQVKKMKMHQIRKSPKKIERVKNNLQSLLKLLIQKQNNQLRLLQTFVYTKSPYMQRQSKKMELNITMDTSNTNNTNNNTTVMSPNVNNINITNNLSNPNNQQINKSWIQRQFGSQPYGMLGFKKSSQSSTQQLQTQLRKIIPKILYIIELYELLTANSKNKYQNLPTIENFVQFYGAKKQVKQALLDLFSSSDLTTNQFINKINYQLPQLRLQSDLYLAKWIQFIYKYDVTNKSKISQYVPQPLTPTPLFTKANQLNNNTIKKQPSQVSQTKALVNAQKKQESSVVQNNSRSKFSIINPWNLLYNSKQTKNEIKRNTIPAGVIQQIKLSDLQSLSEKLQYEQIIKIRHLFETIPSLYLNLLMKQLEYRKMQYQIVRQVTKSKEFNRQDNKLQEEPFYIKTYTSSITQNSLFINDKKKANARWREWLYSETLSLKNQIQAYLQYLANSLVKSPSRSYLQKQNNFDICTKQVLNECIQGKEILQRFIIYLREQKILPQKIYRLSLAIDPNNKTKNLISNLFQNQTRPQLMSSSSLIANLIVRNKQQMFKQLNKQQKMKQIQQMKSQSNNNNNNNKLSTQTMYTYSLNQAKTL